MKELDLILRDGTVVTHEGESVADIGIADGRIVAVGNIPGGKAREEIKADGLHIFPGLIDSHVHFNEPGRADWEGIETGSRALAAGGRSPASRAAFAAAASGSSASAASAAWSPPKATRSAWR